MGSRFGRRADAWPRDMVIGVEPRPAALLELLYVREVRGLDVDAEGALPLDAAPRPTLPDRASPPSSLLPAPDAARWAAAWRAAWAAYADRSVDRVPEDRASLRPLPGFPPREWLDAAERDALTQWQQALVQNGVATTRGHRGPELLAVEALVEAWRTGLETILVLPSNRPFSTRLSRSVAAVSSATRRDPSAYPEALTRIAALAA